MDLENSEKSTKSPILELMDSILLIQIFPFALIYKAQAYNYKLAGAGNFKFFATKRTCSSLAQDILRLFSLVKTKKNTGCQR